MWMIWVVLLQVGLIGDTRAHTGYQGNEINTTGSKDTYASSLDVAGVSSSRQGNAHLALQNEVTRHNEGGTGTKLLMTSDKTKGTPDHVTTKREAHVTMTSKNKTFTRPTNNDKENVQKIKRKITRTPQEEHTNCEGRETPVMTAGNNTHVDADIDMDHLPPASHHRRVKRNNNLPPMETMLSDFEWMDPGMSNSEYNCSTKKLFELLPGLPRELGVEIEFTVRKPTGWPYVIAESLMCHRMMRCTPYPTLRADGYVYVIIHNSPSTRESSTASTRQDQIEDGVNKYTFKENFLQVTTNGHDGKAYDSYDYFKFPLKERALYVGFNRYLGAQEIPQNLIPTGSGLCGIKVKWLRIPEPETEVVRGDYVWRDPAAHQADGSCQERKVVHVLPPSLNATEVVIEFTIKEVSDWTFHVTEGYINDGHGGGGGTGEIHNRKDSLRVFNRDGIEVFRKLGAVTPGKIKISLANNKYLVHRNDKFVTIDNLVDLFQFPLYDGLFLAMNRVVRLIRHPGRTGHGLCAVSLKWTVPDGSQPGVGPLQASPQWGPPPPCIPDISGEKGIPGENGGAAPLIQHKSDNVTLIATIGVGVLLIILILLSCRKSKAQDNGYYPPQDMGHEPYYPPDEGTGYDEQYYSK